MRSHLLKKFFFVAILLSLCGSTQLWGIAVGNLVVATDSLNVRPCASTTACSASATVPSGTRGTVVGGPTSGSGFVWWRVNWTTGASGWSVRDFMAVVPGNFTVSGNAYCNTATPVGPAVLLSWTASPNASSYTVFRNGSQVGPSGITGTTFDNNLNVVAGQTYSYVVRASNANGTTNSNTLSVSVPSNVCPSAPGNFTLSGNPYCNTSAPAGPAVLLTWTISQGASNYTVFRNGSQIGNPTNGTTFDNTLDVVAGQTYSYVVRATNTTGTKNSNTLSVAVPSNVCGTPPPTCHTLSKTHSGSGSNPSVSPASSTGCSSGTYVAGAQLQLSATPATGWTVGSWSGTNNNSSSSATNQATMPGSSHTVGVTYVPTTSSPDFEILDLELFHPNYPDQEPREISTGGAGTTVAGNPVTIRARIKNFGGAGNATTEWRIDGDLIPGGTENRTFAANQELSLEKIWDTEDFAWDANGDPHEQSWQVSVRVVGHDSEEGQLLVRPRPLILVHGLWSDAETWDDYGPIGLGKPGGFVPEAHALWQSYAVGDGFVPDLTMNTGGLSCGGVACVLSYHSNAEVMDSYIDGVREATNAWTVDILGHSMGGLISREYIDRFMMQAPRLASQPPVENLITLGTPHLGTPCSIYALLSGFWVSVLYVEAHFADHSLQGVPLHTLGGAVGLPCPALEEGSGLFYDPVVNLPSALFEETATSHTWRVTHHLWMTSSRDDFLEVVLPILSGEPREANAPVEPQLPPAAGGSSGAAAPVLLHGGQTTLTEGSTTVSVIQVPPAERLAVLLMAGSSVGLRLTGPSGQLAAEQGDAPYRYFEVMNPQPGQWRLEISPLDGGQPVAEFSWYAEGSAYTSVLETEQMEGETLFKVRVTRGGAPVVNAQTRVEIMAENGSTQEITLWDDGQHSDGLPNDGVYGQIAVLQPGFYQSKAKSLIDGFQIGSSAIVLVEGATLFTDGFESGDLSAWTVVGPVGSTLVLFSDNFNDGIYDPLKWTWFGHSVRETEGHLQVNCEVTDQGGGANTVAIPVAPTGLITVSRRARVFAGNHYFDGGLRFQPGLDESDRFGISYADYERSVNGECPVLGFALFRFDANTHLCAPQGIDVTSWIPGIWGTWFREKLEWDPATGAASYYIDEQLKLTMNVGPLPPDVRTLYLRMSTWGWFTGHYQHSDDLMVTQFAP